MYRSNVLTLITVKCKIEAALWVTFEYNHASKCYHEQYIKARLHVPSLCPCPSPPMGTNHLTDRLGSEPILSINVNLTETVRVN